MVTISDAFESLADGAPLSEDPDWDVSLASGTGVPTMDQHDDHSDGTQVVDMSTTGDAYCIHQTQVGNDDHYAECDSFSDKGGTHQNHVGPIVRGSASSYDGTFDGYGAWLYANATGVDVTILGIFRIDDGTPTELTNTGDIGGVGAGEYNPDTDHMVRLEVEGNTLTAFIDGTQELSTTDSTYTTGQYVGFRLYREEASVSSQPFVDNFTGEGAATGNATAEPAVVAGTSSVPAASASAGATVTPAVLSATATLPAASVVTVVEPRLSSTVRMGAP